VRVTGWHVEIRLRIPLDDGSPDGGPGQPDRPKSPAPTGGSRRQRTTAKPVSSGVRLRPAGHGHGHLVAGQRPSPGEQGDPTGGVGSSWVFAGHGVGRHGTASPRASAYGFSRSARSRRGPSASVPAS
jgi:hypothetical protein